MNSLRIVQKLKPNVFVMRAALNSSGSDGKAGAIRDAGGVFAKKEAAQEEQYFRKLQAEQLKNLKTHVSDEISFHEEQIKRHQDALAKAKEDLKKLDK